MSLQPLLEASWVIQLHTFSAIAAFLSGLVQLAAPKGTLPHKSLGAFWIFLMFVTAISSIFLRPSVFGYDLPLLKWFSWIHIVTALTFFWIGLGVFFLMRGGNNLKYHAFAFIMIFLTGIVGAGAFTLLPGRIMHEVVFGVG